VLLGIVVALGLGLRLVDAGARINEDEGYSWLVATAPNAGSFLSRLARYENTPPLFYLLLSPLPLSGEFWLRLPSILAGTASILVLYLIVRSLLGTRAALLAALGLAVAPFAVSYSDYSRGFMVAGLGVLLALLGAQRLASGGRRRWWWIYALGATCTLYSEYYAGLYVLAILGALLAIGRPRRTEVLLLGLIPFLLYLPWVHELVRSINDLGKTKLQLTSSAPTPRLIRDALVPLFFGEHGAASSAALRSVQALALIAATTWGCVRLRRTGNRPAFWLLGGVMIAVIVLFLIVTAADTDIFRERYMTTIIPLAVAVLAGAVATLRWRAAAPIVGGLLAVLGAAVVIVRAGRQYEPDAPQAVALVQSRGYTTILTNSPEISFYGRRLHVVLDRPFGVGNGRPQQACSTRCVVVDDARFGGVRPGTGPTTAIGPIVIRFPPPQR
jgi:mannosyltransferase